MRLRNLMAAFVRRKKINIALQGGGAHGAFTWGVLDQLLENEQLNYEGISGTSAGAVNAVAIACGLMENGPEGARSKLRQIWEKVHHAGQASAPILFPMGVLWQTMTKRTVSKFAEHFSPYEFNPMDINPLHDILNDTIDFKGLRKHSPVKLFIAATNVANGQPKIFTQNEINADMVMASACLPALFKAVKIGKNYYWDGGYSSNPDLINLINETRTCDTLLIQLSPIVSKELPTTKEKILDNINRITFNQPLCREIEVIHRVRQMSRLKAADASERRYQRMRFHLIDASKVTSKLDGKTKMSPEKEVLEYLFDSGKRAARLWTKKHFNDLGKRSSADLHKAFLG